MDWQKNGSALPQEFRIYGSVQSCARCRRCIYLMKTFTTVNGYGVVCCECMNEIADGLIRNSDEPRKFE
jgi:hypothetical protein